MTLHHVSESIDDLMRHIRTHPIKVLSATTVVFGVSERVLVDRDRHKTVHLARMACCLVLRRHGFSYPEIGRTLMRDHTTIMNSVRMAEKTEQTDEQFRSQVQLVERLLRPKHLKLRVEVND